MFGENNKGGGAKTTPVVDKWLKWKGGSDDGFFAYREDGQDIKYSFNKGVLIRKQFQIQGWDTASSSWAKCNKIDNIAEEAFKVYIGDNPVFNGKYNRKAIENLNLKLNLLLTVLDAETGEVLELSINGKGFGKFVEMEDSFNSNENYLEQTTPEDGKAGAIKYKTPIFKEGVAIEKEHKEAALEVVEKIKQNNAARALARDDKEDTLNEEDILF